MDEEILKIVFGELKKSGVKPIDYGCDGDRFVSDPVEVMNSPFLRGDGIPSFWDFSEHDKPFEDEIGKLKGQIVEYLHDINELFDENKELKQRIAELEREKTDLKHGLNKMAKTKSHWIDRAVEWQKKCEKLESEKSEKPVAYVLAKEIDGQHYVTVEDFMSVVDNLQSKAEGV